MNPDRRGKLFHAIVGLGLAAGCGGDVAAAPDDGGRGRAFDASAPDAAPKSGAHDAAQERTSASDVDTVLELDASAPVDATAMSVDANTARDAARDVTLPPPPEIK